MDQWFGECIRFVWTGHTEEWFDFSLLVSPVQFEKIAYFTRIFVFPAGMTCNKSISFNVSLSFLSKSLNDGSYSQSFKKHFRSVHFLSILGF